MTGGSLPNSGDAGVSGPLVAKTHVVEDRTAQMHAAQQVRQGIWIHRNQLRG